eukprot:g391.t1
MSSEVEADLECLVCCSSIPSNEAHFSCPADKSHTQCGTCFSLYIKHCCEMSTLENTIPIKCSIPDCKEMVSDSKLRTLLLRPEIPGGILLWNDYQNAQLRIGLISTKLDTPVTCRRCNNYSELFPIDYQRKARSYIKRIQRDEKEEKKEATRTMLETAKDTIYSALGIVAESVALPSSLPSWNRRGSKKKKKRRSKSKNRPQTPTKPPAAASDDLPTEAPQFIKQESAFTSHFFVCKGEKCGAAICLLCNTLVESSQKQEHACKSSRNFWAELLEVLAVASTTKCPACGEGGMKDLACTHITCKCGVRFCYVCGRDPPEGFSRHNEWRVGPDPVLPGEDAKSKATAEELKTRCPMYLPYKYGTSLSYQSGRYTGGDQKQCLALYHVERQKKAVDQWLKEMSQEDAK